MKEKINLTKEEFQKYLKDFFSWTYSEPKTLLSWLCSLEEWAQQEFNKEYKKENK